MNTEIKELLEIALMYRQAFDSPERSEVFQGLKNKINEKINIELKNLTENKNNKDCSIENIKLKLDEVESDVRRLELQYDLHMQHENLLKNRNFVPLPNVPNPTTQNAFNKYTYPFNYDSK